VGHHRTCGSTSNCGGTSVTAPEGLSSIQEGTIPNTAAVLHRFVNPGVRTRRNLPAAAANL
ncbi:hypothetical protein, partial [Mesorhizobium sp. M2E.F.Ca.ET.154.01.1.1]|uniref:hypothetical protein n=1 Tax=Mesorhizobium sp. M2E.F.Ca.ET.154.01.1.1 TaxID=2500521 RepID=UPI001AEEF265